MHQEIPTWARDWEIPPNNVLFWWVFMGYNPQESLENTINTMGTLLEVHPSLSLDSVSPQVSGTKTWTVLAKQCRGARHRSGWSMGCCCRWRWRNCPSSDVSTKSRMGFPGAKAKSRAIWSRECDTQPKDENGKFKLLFFSCIKYM